MAKRKLTEGDFELVHSSRFTALLVPSLPQLNGKVIVKCAPEETVLFDFKLVEPGRTTFILFANAKEMLLPGSISRRFEELRSRHIEEYIKGAATIVLLTRSPESTKAFSLRQVMNNSHECVHLASKITEINFNPPLMVKRELIAVDLVGDAGGIICVTDDIDAADWVILSK